MNVYYIYIYMADGFGFALGVSCVVFGCSVFNNMLRGYGGLTGIL